MSSLLNYFAGKARIQLEPKELLNSCSSMSGSLQSGCLKFDTGLREKQHKYLQWYCYTQALN